SSTGASLATLTNGGNLGIGTTSPSQALSVQGNGLISGNLASANLTVTGTLTAGIINASGAITGGTNSAFGGTTQCCAVSQTPTIAISEVGATKFPWIQFHASGYQEAYMRLATSSRLFEFGDNQAVGVGLAVLNNAGTARSVVISGNSNSYFNGGNLGIGTTTPYSRLTVWGPDSAATTSAFTVTNSASTTVFAVYDNGNSTYSGSIFQSSDQRLKTNILSLDASSSLAAVEALNPVSYTRVDQTAEGQNLGFIAQQVANVFPQLVSTTSATTLTPDGTLTLNYVGLIAPIIGAIQGIAHIAGDFKENLVAWLGDAANGIHDLYVSIFHAKEVHTDMLCVGETCVTQAQFLQMVQKSGQSDPAPPPAPAPTPDPTPDPTPAPDPTPTPVTP
ncbi:MAG: tail fiber domain-containing protein, partial [bacterium]